MQEDKLNKLLARLPVDEYEALFQKLYQNELAQRRLIRITCFDHSIVLTPDEVKFVLDQARIGTCDAEKATFS